MDGLRWCTLLSSSWTATVGTGLDVLVPGLPPAHHGYVELYRNTEHAVFQYTAQMGSDDVVAKRQPFRGTFTMLFAGSRAEAHRACVLLGILATCRTIAVPVQAFLTWVFERLGTHREMFGLTLEALTPTAVKASGG